jgi:hypothetical protein
VRPENGNSAQNELFDELAVTAKHYVEAAVVPHKLWDSCKVSGLQIHDSKGSSNAALCKRQVCQRSLENENVRN